MLLCSRNPFYDDVPYVVLDSSENTAHKKLLEKVHDRVVAYHANIDSPVPKSVEKPTHAVLVLWDYSISGLGAAWHEFKV